MDAEMKLMQSSLDEYALHMREYEEALQRQKTVIARLTAERDAAVSDLQDAVDFVYGVYGKDNDTLAAITTAHWRAIIKAATLKGETK